MATTDVTLCVHCKATLEAGADKCRHCGEWRDERWRVSDAGKVCLALIAVNLFGMASLALTWVPPFRTMLAEFRSAPPAWTNLVLAPWWLPAWMVVVAGAVVAAFVFVRRSRPRGTVLACALAVGLAAVIACWTGPQLAISPMASVIRAE